VESQGAAKARSELEQARLQLQEGERSIRAFIQESYQTLELQRIKLEYANARQQVWAAELAQKRAILNAGGGTEGEYLAMVLEALGGIAETYGTLAEYRSTLLGLELVLGR
jgi:hypothetical protein